MVWKAFFSVIAILALTVTASGVPDPDRRLTTRQSQNKYVFAHFMVSTIPADGDFMSAVADLR
jgi:hypothetical protein